MNLVQPYYMGTGCCLTKFSRIFQQFTVDIKAYYYVQKSRNVTYQINLFLHSNFNNRFVRCLNYVQKFGETVYFFKSGEAMAAIIGDIVVFTIEKI